MIRAVVVDSEVEGRLKIAEVEQPVPTPSQALVRVRAFSLNLGEVRTTTRAEAGWRPGWDLAGVVERAAADGSGPAVGSRVFGLVASGSWAELVAVPTALLAEIPERVSYAQAATLPVAALTALYAMEKGGFLLGRNVLVTGASGGVGRFACQLARQAGATVTALVRRAEREASMRAIGVNHVAVGENVAAARTFGPYDYIVDTLGGDSLREALSLLATEGRCINIGAATMPDMTLQARLESVPDGVLLLEGIGSRTDIARQMRRLAMLVAEERLEPQIVLDKSWNDIAEAAQSLLNRGISGKAVLHVS
jgi:NADPH:quinone reductase-like Zn-dependent oxidoreductase